MTPNEYQREALKTESIPRNEDGAPYDMLSVFNRGIRTGSRRNGV